MGNCDGNEKTQFFCMNLILKIHIKCVPERKQSYFKTQFVFSPVFCSKHLGMDFVSTGAENDVAMELIVQHVHDQLEKAKIYSNILIWA